METIDVATVDVDQIGGSNNKEKLGDAVNVEVDIECTDGTSNKCEGITVENFYKNELNSSEEWYEMYCVYAKSIGFGVRKGDVHRDSNGNLTHRRFFCNRAGRRDDKCYTSNRKRDHKPDTRTNCQALLSIYLDRRSETWKTRKLVEEHNHDLTPLPFVHLIPTYRQIKDSDKMQIDSMHRNGIPASQIMRFLAGQAGGYEGVGFSKKDLYNYIDRSRQARINDGDANAAIIYLQGKRDAQPMSVVKYSSAEEDKLGNLFWADGVSRVDYQHFGDVVAFDATYKKNKYNRPLVIFSGTNHHKQTCIFGFGLVGDETIETYKWLLENFLEVMMGKEPSVVVTDGDRAMREAIRVVFPNATHRLCGWHLQKNATTNLKNSGFCEALKGLIYGNYEEDVFERVWEETVALFGLQENEWVEKIYEMKEMWATAYLRGKFCAGFRTTSRCEGINSFIKRFVQSRQSILELVQNLERALAAYRNNELESQFKSIYGVPVLTTGLDGMEQSAAKVYTREIFLDVKKQIEDVISLIVLDIDRIGTTIIYKLSKYGREGREYTVLFDNNLDKYECSRQMWNGYGIPCSHLFCVMKHEHVIELPKSLVLQRWCKDAKRYVGKYVCAGDNDSEENVLLRYGALAAASNWMSYLGAKRLTTFRETMDEVNRISRELEQKYGVGEIGGIGQKDPKVGDPDVVKSKGAPRIKKVLSRKRMCSNCNVVGHTKRTCPKSCTTSSILDDDCELPSGSYNELSHITEVEEVTGGNSGAYQIPSQWEHTGCEVHLNYPIFGNLGFVEMLQQVEDKNKNGGCKGVLD